ncbi:MAG: 4-hydroxybenzoate octaprenyltransferase [Betaproteobacteria bacterium]|nr:MAG: 4-hydroxybenzoate octaprenyltransferase [Betaproteobacteria bacterium]
MSDTAPDGRVSLPSRARIDAYVRLLRLDKPIGTLLLLWPTMSALWFATDGVPPVSLVAIFAVGTLLMRSAGCAFNDWADRDFDAFVARTASRPLAAKIITPREALVLAAALALAAFVLILPTNRATIAWSIPAVAIAIAYPFFKRFFALPQAFLGIAFSFGIPMAFAAVQNDVPAFAWLLLVINLFWVVAYDTEYAMVDRDDDVAVGIRTSALTFGRFDVAAVALCYAIYVFAMTLVGFRNAMGTIYYAGLAIAFALAVQHLWWIRTREREQCFRAFLDNHWLGFAVFSGVALDFAVRLHRWPHVW